ncbi:MAG: alpha/beta hydrolase [Calditrichaeota bacterium]|nr:alpha/beta hydrolase [Calditrichota bacterium]
MQILDQHLPIAGHSIFTRRLIPRGLNWDEGPVVVLLHDGLGAVSTWKDLPERLARDFQLGVLLYDRPGHGLSSPLAEPYRPDYLHRQAFDILPALLEKLGVKAPHLLGHSDGGSIALLFGGAFPARVQSITTFAAHVLVEPITLTGIRDTVTVFRQPGNRLREALMRHHGDKTDTLFGFWSGVWMSGDYSGWNIEKEIAPIEAPVLAMQGAEDQYGTPDQLSRIAGAVQGPVSTVLLPGVGHALDSRALLDQLRSHLPFLRSE